MNTHASRSASVARSRAPKATTPAATPPKSRPNRRNSRPADAKIIERTLLDLTAIPTAAGREHRVVRWIEGWVAKRPDVTLSRDRHGNLLLRQSKVRPRKGIAPIWFQAHLDHPAFVVRALAPQIELEFRGGVHDPYFVGAALEIFDSLDRAHVATITSVDTNSKPFKIVRTSLAKPAPSLAVGDIGRWRLPKAKIANGLLHTHGCDDLAAVAAALCAFDRIRVKPGHGHVGVFLTRSEEIGFIGTIGAARDGTLSKDSRIICLENSRSFPESPIGGGPIVRVGDRRSVFVPELTNRISDLLLEYQKTHPDFRYQRKLMPGGTCEATAYASYGHVSTCLCLPLGNYHNMVDIDGVLAGQRPALVGHEFVSMDDCLGLIEMLEAITDPSIGLDGAKLMTMRQTMETLWTDLNFVLS
jgi:putative aminopeptidase FrvX